MEEDKLCYVKAIWMLSNHKNETTWRLVLRKQEYDVRLQIPKSILACFKSPKQTVASVKVIR